GGVVAKARRRLGAVVGDDHRRRAGVLRVERLGLERAAAAVDQRDGAGHVRGDGVAAVGIAALRRQHRTGGGEGVRAVVGGVEVQRADAGRGGDVHRRAAGHRAVPQEHALDRRAAVRRGLHVGVVAAAVVLGLGLDRVARHAAAAVVVGLRVAGGFVEAVLVPGVMQPVVDEELVDDRRLALARRGRVDVDGVRIVEGAGGADRAADVAAVEAVAAGDVGEGHHVVAGGGGRAARQPGVVLGGGVGDLAAVVQGHQVVGALGAALVAGGAAGERVQRVVVDRLVFGVERRRGIGEDVVGVVVVGGQVLAEQDLAVDRRDDVAVGVVVGAVDGLAVHFDEPGRQVLAVTVVVHRLGARAAADLVVIAGAAGAVQ